MLINFSFVIAKRLAGLGRPGEYGDTLLEDLRELRSEGIAAIVTLTREPLEEQPLREAGLDYLHLPIADFHPPSRAQIIRFVSFVEEKLAAPQGAVAVHCFAGMGRTGTMLSAYLVSTGIPAAEAISTVRRLRPGSIETQEQSQAIFSYEAYLKEMGKWKGAAKPNSEGGEPAKPARGKSAPQDSSAAADHAIPSKNAPPPKKSNGAKPADYKNAPQNAPTPSPHKKPVDQDLFEDAP